MKLIYISLVATIICLSTLIMPLKASASPEVNISVTTSRQIYARGDKVVVSGTVSETLKSTAVAIKVIKPDGKLWVAQAIPTAQRSFEVTVATIGANDPLGLYTVTAWYGASNSSTSFLVLTTQIYPLTWENRTFSVTVSSDSTLQKPIFNQPEKYVELKVEAQVNKPGISIITIPRELLNGPFLATVDVSPVKADVKQNDSYSTLTVNYAAGAHTIRITGTKVIPEFPYSAAASLTLTLIGALAATALLRRVSRGSYPSPSLNSS